MTNLEWFSSSPQIFYSPQIFLTVFFIFFKINHTTSSNLYRFYYPHRSRELVSPVCGIFTSNTRVGKNIVFAMTIKLIPEFWRNQEIPEKFWKTYEQVKLDLFQIFYLFLILFLIPEFCHPEPRPTTL